MGDKDEELVQDEEFPVSPKASSLLRHARRSLSSKEPEPPQVDPFTVDDLDEVPPETLPVVDIASNLQVERDPKDAKETLEFLDRKIQEVTTEFTKGNINQAQYEVVFTHYHEQRALVERILSRNPVSDSWQQAAAGGFTDYLRQQHAAEVMGYALCDNRSGKIIQTIGKLDLQAELLAPMLASLSEADVAQGAKCTQIEGGRWLVLVPGQYTAAVMLFSNEPTGEQLKTITTLHREFEKENLAVLERGEIDPEQLTYPVPHK